ncbi:MAG: hypothetical protein M3457_14765 [Chloroflexota bacterium]|nr:hypothetical protein [Chloroflexota bacterium]
MTQNRDGMLMFEPDFDSIVVRFERTLPYSPAQVWERWWIERISRSG